MITPKTGLDMARGDLGARALGWEAVEHATESVGREKHAQDALTTEAPPLSVFIIAHNEADRLPATLLAVRGLAREIIVVDSGSTDDTVAVAQAYGARVIVNAPFPGYGPQKRVGEAACTQPWLLNLDADEVVSPALAREILALFAQGNPPADAYRLAIADVLPGENTPRRWAYCFTPVRLYRASCGQYADALVHDRVALAAQARVSALAAPVLHFSLRSLSHQLVKLDAYSTLQAHDFVSRGRRLPAWRLFTDFPIAFLKALIGRRLFMGGIVGVLMAINYGLFRHMRATKIYDLQRIQPAGNRSKASANEDGRPFF